jgi:hypothetical protein
VTPTGPDVRIVVERLVFDGVDVPPGAVDAVVAELGDELRRRVLSADAPPGWADAARVRAPSVGAAASPERLGQALGGAVHAGLENTR